MSNGHDSKLSAARSAAEIAAAEDNAALAAINDVLADGRVDSDEIETLRFALAKVARSAKIDAQIASGTGLAAEGSAQ